jgi:hypothetical protein
MLQLAGLMSFALIPNEDYTYSRTTPLVPSFALTFLSIPCFGLGVPLKVTALLGYQLRMVGAGW